MPGAILGGAIMLYFQPEVVCATGALAGFEVLARWRHPEQGLVPPARFVPLAHTSGLIDELTLPVTDYALRWLAPLCIAGNGTRPAMIGALTGMPDLSTLSRVARCPRATVIAGQSFRETL